MKKEFENIIASFIAYTLFYLVCGATAIGINFPFIVAIIKLFE